MKTIPVFYPNKMKMLNECVMTILMRRMSLTFNQAMIMILKVTIVIVIM